MSFTVQADRGLLHMQVEYPTMERSDTALDLEVPGRTGNNVLVKYYYFLKPLVARSVMPHQGGDERDAAHP